MIKEKFGSRLDGWMLAVAPFLFRRVVNPNVLTVMGACISLVAAAAFAQGAFVAGGLLTLAGGGFDLIDGVVARRHGISTRFGAFLDSTLDRLVDMALFLGIAVHYAQVARPDVVLLAGAALVPTVLVSYSKACAELSIGPMSVGLFERAERVGVVALGAILGMVIPALWVVAIGSTVTVAQRFVYAHREMKRIDAEECAGLGELS
ncbi:MAG: CDP-alcohol phosphatidyltransferase family protein [Myxococcota bacterium]